MNKNSGPQGTMPNQPLSFSDLNIKADDFAVKLSDRLIQFALESQASDLHLDSTPSGLVVQVRTHGMLSEVATVPQAQTQQLIARLKSMAGLLSYRSDLPQEGRIRLENGRADARICTLPTMHGERLVIRFSISQSHHWKLKDLGLPESIQERVNAVVGSASGVVLICGPAGSGKTTTAYAIMQQLADVDRSIRRSLVSLEDPIEQAIDGVAQSQIQPNVGYTWAAGLKAMLRQDPEVMLIGEIRDAETAHVVFQAAMTGQLVVSTMHARSAADAVARLIDMEVPKHQILSGLSLLIAQRLVRNNLAVTTEPMYRDRLLVAEALPVVEGELKDAILSESSVKRIHEAAVSQGLVPLREQALALLASRKIDESTFRRHFEWHRNEE